MKFQTINLTATERGILLHRLEVPDALADSLEERFTREITEKTSESLRNYLANSGEIFFGNDLCADAILDDCCNGSTFFAAGSEDAVATGELSRGKLLSQYKAANSLEKKFAQVGRRVSIPRE